MSEREELVAGPYVEHGGLRHPGERHRDPIAGRAERGIGDPEAGCVDPADQPSRRRLDDPNEVLERPRRGNERSVGAERDGADGRVFEGPTLVPESRVREPLAGRGVPDDQRAVVAGGRQHRAVGRERHVVDVDLVSLEGGERGLAGLRVTDVDQPAVLGPLGDEHPSGTPVEGAAEIGHGELDARRRHGPVERLLGLEQDRVADRVGRVDRLERQQDAPLRVDVEVGDRGRGELAGDRGSALLLGGATLGHREHGETDGDERRDSEHADDGAQSTHRSALQVAFVRGASLLVGEASLAFRERHLEELSLLRRDGDPRAGLPGGRLLQA